MSTKVKKVFKVIGIALLVILLCLGIVLGAIFTSSYVTGKKSVALQQERIQALDTKYSQGYVPLDEQQFAAFNLEENASTPLNEIQFLGTHNSYKNRANFVSKIVNWFTAVLIDQSSPDTYSYIFEPLSTQLDQGVRSFELDLLAKEDNQFLCSHHALFDDSSHCLDFPLALQELKKWSDANPGHMPVTVLVELKDWLLPLPSNQEFNSETMRALDQLLQDALGDSLYRPADMMDNHTNLQEALDAEGWPTLSELRGKILFILHPNKISEEYITSDSTMQSQSLFPMLESTPELLQSKTAGTELPWQKNAVIFMLNSPNSQFEEIKQWKEAGFMVRTRSDSYPDFDPAVAQKAVDSGANIISTDRPPFSEGSSMTDDGIIFYPDGKHTMVLDKNLK